MIQLPPRSTLLPYTARFRAQRRGEALDRHRDGPGRRLPGQGGDELRLQQALRLRRVQREDRKSTRLNSSHANISYAVFCLKNKLTRKPGRLLRLVNAVGAPY